MRPQVTKLIPVAILAAAMLGTLVATWQAARANAQREAGDFKEAAHGVRQEIQGKLDVYHALVRATAGLFVGSDHVRPAEFAGFVSRVRIGEVYPGMRAVAFVPRVEPDQVGQFNRAISELHGRQMSLWPPGGRPAHYPIALVQPWLDSKWRLIGFDLASEPVRLEFLERARDSGATVVSGPIELVEPGVGPNRGFLIAAGLYAPEGARWNELVGGPTVWPPPTSVEGRRQRLQGFVVVAIIIEEMVDAAVLASGVSRKLQVEIYQGQEPPGERLYPARDGSWTAPGRAGLHESIEVAGQPWTLHVFDDDAGGVLQALGLGARARPEARLVPLVFLAGTGFSLALFWVSRGQVRARAAAERAAGDAVESEARFRRIADAAPVMIGLTGPDGRTTWANLAALEFTGKGMDDLLGDGWIDLIPAEDRGAAREGVAAALKERRPLTRAVRARRADGELRWLSVTARPVLARGAVFLGYVACAVDVTDQRVAIERLGEFNRELSRSNADLSEFASIAAHDLKEPLRGMRNFAHFLAVDHARDLPGEARDQLETIERLADRMTLLLDAIYEYARVGQGELRREEIDLAEACRHAIEALNSQVTERPTEITCHQMPRVWGDPILVQQLFTNLMANGLKYNTSTPRRLEIGVRDGAGREGGPSVLFVRDNGIGIPPEHRERVFQMFRRLHGREKFGGGLGAGLAIARKIVERHGGRIWVESELGQGTTVFFTLAPEPHHVELGPLEARRGHPDGAAHATAQSP